MRRALQSSAPVQILGFRSRPARVIAADPSDLNPRLGRVLRLDRTGGLLDAVVKLLPRSPRAAAVQVAGVVFARRAVGSAFVEAELLRRSARGIDGRKKREAASERPPTH